jgi:mRNA interferase RelE/StbE
MYKISYHHKVADDIKTIGGSDKKRIKKIIETKLALEPLLFGKPLQYSLKGLRSLKVGDYRIVFVIEDKEIFVVLIAHRREVYTEVKKRI